MESVLKYCSICFFPAVSVSHKKYASPHLQNCFQDHRPPHTACLSLTQRAMVTKAHAVASDLTSVQNAEKRFENSFIPQAIIRACVCVYLLS